MTPATVSPSVTILLRRALWHERGWKCQSCNQGSKARLYFWVIGDAVKEGRLLCYQCATITIADILKAGVELEIKETTLVELELEMKGVNIRERSP